MIGIIASVLVSFTVTALSKVAEPRLYMESQVEAAEETEATATPEATEETEVTTTPEVTEAASYNTDSSLEVTDGNKVNIDYVGKIDGVAFDGGSTDGKGTDLVIGSGTYIDNFEE